MNWLARIELDYEQVARKRLNDSYRWHQAAWDAFEDEKKRRNTIKKSKPAKQFPAAFIYRIKRKNLGVELLMLSEHCPRRPSWCPQACFQSKEIHPAFLSHRHYFFDLFANPTRKVKKSNGKSGFTKNGKRLTLLQPDIQRKWLYRKAEDSGFRIDSQRPLETGPAEFQPFFRNGKKGLHIGVQFKGLLEVTDQERFKTAFSQGIGSAKGFGFGMLIINPVKI